MSRIVYDRAMQTWEAWADPDGRDYLGGFETEAEAVDAVQRAEEFDRSEDAYEHCVMEATRTRRMFGYP